MGPGGDRPRVDLPPRATVGLVAVGAALALWLLAAGDPPSLPADRADPAAPVDAPETLRPPGPGEHRAGVWDPPGDVLASAVPGGVLVVDPATGDSTLVGVTGTAVAVAPGPSGSAFVLQEGGVVDLVDLRARTVEPFAADVDWFAPSAEPGRVWIRSADLDGVVVEVDADHATHKLIRREGSEGDPRFEVDADGALLAYTDGGIVQVGRGEPVATTADDAYTATCEGRRCRIERLPADGAAPAAELAARPYTVDDVRVSGDGRWLVSLGSHLSLYETDRTRVDLTHTGAVDARFSTDSRFLYVVAHGRVDVIDLVGTDDRTVPVAALTARHHGEATWSVIPA